MHSVAWDHTDAVRLRSEMAAEVGPRYADRTSIAVRDGVLTAMESPLLVIHGGAGTIERARMKPGQEAEIRAALSRALEQGSAVLAAGGDALDAVEAAVKVLEDDPNFNAGRGAVFTYEGTNELDAAIMDGTTLNAGAVAGLAAGSSSAAAGASVAALEGSLPRSAWASWVKL